MTLNTVHQQHLHQQQYSHVTYRCICIFTHTLRLSALKCRPLPSPSPVLTQEPIYNICRRACYTNQDCEPRACEKMNTKEAVPRMTPIYPDSGRTAEVRVWVSGAPPCETLSEEGAWPRMSCDELASCVAAKRQAGFWPGQEDPGLMNISHGFRVTWPSGEVSPCKAFHSLTSDQLPQKIKAAMGYYRSTKNATTPRKRSVCFLLLIFCQNVKWTAYKTRDNTSDTAN